ncbi:MAG: GumC family protein [Prochloraceae cyanobacterium]
MNKRQSSNIFSQEIDKNNSRFQSRFDLTNNLIRVFKYRFPLIVAFTLGFATIFGIWSLVTPSKYRSKFQLSIDKPVESNNLIAGINAKGIEYKDNDYATEIEILRSRRVLEPIISIISVKYPEINYQTLVSDRNNSPLNIARLKNTDILEVFYQDKNPEKIKYVLDNLAAGYLDYGLQAKNTAIESGIAHLQIQLPTARQKVSQLQQEQLALKEKYGLLDPKQQSEILTKKIIELEEKYFNSQVELNEKKSLYLILERQLGQDIQTAIASSHLSESTRYQELLAQLQEIEIKLANGASIWQENSPMLVSLRDKKVKILTLLDRQARASLGNNLSIDLQNTVALTSTSSLRLKLNQQYILAANEIEILRFRTMALAEAIKSLNQKIAEMPLIISEYNELERKLTLATQSLHNLLSQKERLELEAAKQASLWQPISRAALPAKPISPHKGTTIAMGVVAGLFFGAIAALIADRSDLSPKDS